MKGKGQIHGQICKIVIKKLIVLLSFVILPNLLYLEAVLYINLNSNA